MQLAYIKYALHLFFINNNYLESHVIPAAIQLAWKGIRDYDFFPPELTMK